MHDHSLVSPMSLQCLSILVSGIDWIMLDPQNCTVRPGNRTKPMEARSDNDIASGLKHHCITLPEHRTSQVWKEIT